METAGFEPPRGLKWRQRAARGLFAVGLLAMVGDALDARLLRGIGVSSMVAPLPKVFSDVRGHETFAADFTVLVDFADGSPSLFLPITPEVYSRLFGPYNRRNVYGAALSYAPRLPDELWRAPFCHGLRHGGPIRRELGVPRDAHRVRVEIRTRTAGRDDVWILEDPCAG